MVMVPQLNEEIEINTDSDEISDYSVAERHVLLIEENQQDDIVEETEIVEDALGDLVQHNAEIANEFDAEEDQATIDDPGQDVESEDEYDNTLEDEDDNTHKKITSTQNINSYDKI